MTSIATHRIDLTDARQLQKMTALRDACLGFVDLYDEQYLGIEADGRLAACAAIGYFDSHGRKFALLHTECVHPDFRGRGFHVDLVRQRLTIAHDAGCNFAVATTKGSNSTAARVLRGNGFTVQSWLPAGRVEGVNEWVLEIGSGTAWRACWSSPKGRADRIGR